MFKFPCVLAEAPWWATILISIAGVITAALAGYLQLRLSQAEQRSKAAELARSAEAANAEAAARLSEVSKEQTRVAETAREVAEQQRVTALREKESAEKDTDIERRSRETAQKEAVLARKEKELAEARAFLIRRGIVETVPLPPGDRRNSVILLGLGGVGKSSMVNALTVQGAADTSNRTERFAIYRGSIAQNANPNDKANRHVWLFVSDYAGQNLGQVVANFALEQKRLFSPMTYGAVNSLVLIVDLVKPKSNQTAPDPEPRASPDRSRIKENIDQWTDTALEAIFGLFTKESLKYVCLFINKIDLVEKRTEADREEYKSAYAEIRNRLVKRAGSATFEMIVGSVGNSPQGGEGVQYLRRRLAEYAVGAAAELESKAMLGRLVDDTLARQDGQGPRASDEFPALVRDSEAA